MYDSQKRDSRKQGKKLTKNTYNTYTSYINFAEAALTRFNHHHYQSRPIRSQGCNYDSNTNLLTAF